MSKGRPKGLGKGSAKGKGKGKSSKPGKDGFRAQQHRHVAPQLSFDAPKGKGKGKSFSKGKGKPSRFGDRGKGESFPPKAETGSSSHTPITCGFCHRLDTSLI